MRMRGLEPPQSYLHTDLNRIEGVSLRPGASDASKLRGLVDGSDAVDGTDVVTMLSRLDLREGLLAGENPEVVVAMWNHYVALLGVRTRGPRDQASAHVAKLAASIAQR